MATRINYNYEAAVTYTSLKQNERLLNKSLLRLSTGLRILSAADDASGLFIADQLAVVSAGLEQGNRNIQFAISALQIAEGGVAQIFDKLKAIYQRAVNAANDINDPNARAALQRDITNLIDAIQKIGTDTEYNGINLLDGSFTNKYIHYGARFNQVVYININDVRAQSLGAYIVEGNGNILTSVANTTLAADLNTSFPDYAVTAGDYFRVNGQTVLEGPAAGTYLLDAATVAQNINADATLQQAGIEAVAENKSLDTNLYNGVFTVTGGNGNETLQLDFYVGYKDVTGAPDFSITLTPETTLSDLVTQINSYASDRGLGITAKAQDGKLVLETTNGETIAVQVTFNDPDATATADVDFGQLLEGAGTVTGLGNGQSAYAVKIGSLKIYGVDNFTVNENGVDLVGAAGPDTSLTSTFKNLYAIDVTSNPGAEEALLIVKKALQKVDIVRTAIGSVINNLQSIYDAQAVAKDNTDNAENVIRNVDFAKEMTEFTKYQIRMQSGVAMLAQANTLPQLVLQLLR